MWTFIARRLLLMVPTLIGVTVVFFLLLRVAYPDPTSAHIAEGQQMSAAQVESMRQYYGLDQPWYVQYGRMVRSLVTLDLQRWEDRRPVAEVIGEALPITLLLSLLSLAIAYVIAIPLGVYSAVKQYTLTDRVIAVVLFMLYSLPSFWVGIMLLVFFASGHFVNCVWSDEPGCFPLQGWHAFEGFEAMSFVDKVTDVAWHLVLPIIVLTYNAFAAISRYTRTAMLESIRQDYIRTARAKGLGERAVVVKHALRNSLLPIITLLGLTFPYLISGAVITETIFGIPGMGKLTLDALLHQDYPFAITFVALTAILTMVGILASDILYAVADPRIRYGKEGK